MPLLTGHGSFWCDGSHVGGTQELMASRYVWSNCNENRCSRGTFIILKPRFMVAISTVWWECWRFSPDKPLLSSSLTITQVIIYHWFHQCGLHAVVTTNPWKQFELTSASPAASHRHLTNEMFNNFHRILKSALMSYPDPANGVHSNGIVLLTILTTIKEDIECLEAKVIFNTIMRLPDEFICPSKNADRTLTSSLNH